jgi:predicted RecB family nuclease
VEVASTQLVHVDTAYFRGEGEPDWDRLYARREVAGEVEELLVGVPDRLHWMQGVLREAGPPEVEPGPHCRSPVRCEFWEHCTGGKPADWVLRLPGLRSGRFEELRHRGIERIRDIPEEFSLTPYQLRARQACRTGGPVVEDGLAVTLEDLGPPACYLDFETTAPALPLYPGTRPYEPVPFQWSLLRWDGGPAPTHREFLAEGREDPRRAFAETLLEALDGPGEPVLVYSPYEATILKRLAEHLPDLAGGLDGLRGRLRDLHRVVRAHVYHPGFGGSFSVKAVAPALAPGFGYGDLQGVAGGEQASLAFPRLADPRTDPEECEKTREALRAYCKRDTEAMLELHRALRVLAEGDKP